MRKHVNLFTVIMVAIVIASMLAKAKGIPTHDFTLFGFSSGG
jgi:hypothetical protein